MAVERRLVGSSCIFLISISLVTHINILQPLFGPWRMLPLSFLSTPCLKLSSSTNRSIIGGTSPENSTIYVYIKEAQKELLKTMKENYFLPIFLTSHTLQHVKAFSSSYIFLIFICFVFISFGTCHMSFNFSKIQVHPGRFN